MKDESVIVQEERKEVKVLVQDESGKVRSQKLGEVISRVYMGEKVQRHEFEPASGSDQLVTGATKKSKYSLGPTTTQFQFVDHETAVKPLIKNGYHIEKQLLGKGGLSLYSILSPVNPIEWEDSIHWDESLWNPVPGAKMRESVIVSTSIKPGKGIWYSRGIFRLICTNGLVSEIMNFGQIRMNHANFDSDKILDAMNIKKELKEGERRGPLVGNIRGAKRLIDTLHRVAEFQGIDQQSDDEDEEEENTQALRLEDVPLFARSAVNTLTSQPTWYTQGLIDQFEAMVNYFKGKDSQGVYAVDLINATTSPFNLRARNQEVETFRPISRGPAVAKSVSHLLGAMSL